RLEEERFPEVRPSEVRPAEVRVVPEVRLDEVRAPEARLEEERLPEVRPAEVRPLRSALLRSGRMSGVSRRHPSHAFTPCLRIATCSLFAMEAHPVSGERYHVVASLALALLAGPGPTRRALSAVAYLLRFAAAPDARTIARRQEHGRRHPPAEGISGHDNHRA